MSRIFGFDLARALALAIVVLAHLHTAVQDVGIYGVELFFALSGFLIGTILYRCVPESGPWAFAGLKNFWQRRWWRTLPAYYLFLIVAVVIYAGRQELPQGGLAGVIPYLFFCPNLLSPNESFYDISWSLFVEEAFYLLFPLTVFCLQRFTGCRLASFFWSLVVFFVGCVLLREWSFASYPAAQTRVVTLPRLDAIGWGVGVAVLVQVKDLSLRTRWGLATTGSIILGNVLVSHFLERPLDDATWFFRLGLIAMPASFALMMPLLSVWNQLPAALERVRLPVTAISLWSYSIYLCHHMIMLATYPLFGELREHFAVKMFSKVVALIVILVLSRFVYRNFESRWTRRRPAEIHGSTAASVPETIEFPSHHVAGSGLAGLTVSSDKVESAGR